MKFLYLILAWLLPGLVLAAGNQDMSVLEKLADRFMQQEVSHRQASYKLGKLDRRLVLPPVRIPRVDWSTLHRPAAIPH
jgi:flagella basal body P-ring formation protein FlgA